MGVLVGSHGLRGEVKLRPLTEFPERLPGLRFLRLRRRDGTEEVRKVTGTRLHGEMVLVTLDGVPDRSAADALRGAHVLVEASEAPPLPEGRYYLHQLVGLRVVTQDGEELGRVREVIQYPANDVYVAGEYLIPATHDAVVRLAPEEGLIVVRSRAYLEGEQIR